MKIDIFDVEELIKLNKLKPVTSSILYQKGDIPHPEGLVSNEIFGITTVSRKETYAYIDLHGHFFHPHIYKAIRRMFRDIDYIVNGSKYFSIDKSGHLVKDDENGNTGIEWLYDNWEKINWVKEKDNDEINMRVEREGLLKNYPKNKIFMKYQLVIPPYYRDVNSTSGKGNEVDDINHMYSSLIRLASLLKDRGLFDFEFNSTNYEIQLTIIDIYNYFKLKLEKKNGIIRKYLMGKNVDYSARTVITAPRYVANRPEDCTTSFRYSNIPISQLCSLAYPFMMQWIKGFFEREILDKKNQFVLYDASTGEYADDNDVQGVNLESYFSDKYIHTLMDTFVRDPESRFNLIEVPTTSKRKLYLTFHGKQFTDTNDSEVAPIVKRPMTYTDLLFLAASDVVKNKCALLTRYPVNNEFGIFASEIRVNSTIKTVPMLINGILYKWYPYIDLDTPRHLIGTLFIDSCQFSNSHLLGLDGDYDGDQMTVKILFTQEANEEARNFINNKANFITSDGHMIKVVELEAIQTFYVLTKDPDSNISPTKPLTKDEINYFINLKPEDISLQSTIKWFGDNVSISDGDKHKKSKKSKFNTTDTFKLTPEMYPSGRLKTSIDTTIGRFLFNKCLIEGCNLSGVIEYINTPINTKGMSKLDNSVGNALKLDIINGDTIIKYIDTRDWFGLSLNSVLCTSITPNLIKLSPELKAYKKKLLKEHRKEIEDGDNKVVENIEKELINAYMKKYGNDVGLDLFKSGARGSVGNNLKNIIISRGSVSNPVTNKYDIITSSLMEGLEKKDIPPHSNSIVLGAYPKTVETAVTGYMSKELTSAMQNEVLGPKNSNCGTKRTINIEITKNNAAEYLDRFIVENNKLVLLTKDNINKYIGKTVKLRSPMMCIGVGKEKNLCNVCAGNFFYQINKLSIGLSALLIGTKFTALNMKKFHDNQIKTKEIDLDDILL